MVKIAFIGYLEGSKGSYDTSGGGGGRGGNQAFKALINMVTATAAFRYMAVSFCNEI